MQCTCQAKVTSSEAERPPSPPNADEADLRIPRQNATPLVRSALPTRPNDLHWRLHSASTMANLHAPTLPQTLRDFEWRRRRGTVNAKRPS